MGQQEVYEFLKKNPDKWFTSREISENLNVSIGSVTMNLKKLRKSKLIAYRNTGKKNMFQYMFLAKEEVKKRAKKGTSKKSASKSKNSAKVSSK
ncbi:MAG: winged helix-turn-helix domain-containing protein [Nanobdellota archaeon]